MRTKRNTGKQMLLKMAARGCRKPAAYTKEYDLLYRWIKNCHAFRERLAAIRPDWLVKTRDPNYVIAKSRNTGERLRQTILELAEIGEPRPKSRTPEGTALYFLRKRDPEFNNTIRALRPDWFTRVTK